MGAVLGLLFGVGLLLIWSAFLAPRPRSAARRSRLRPLLGSAGLGDVSVTGFVIVSTVCAFVATVVVLLASHTVPVAVVFGAMGGYLPVAVPGRVENDIVETEPVFVRKGGDLVHTGGMPTRLDSFERVGVDVHRILRGAD